MGFSSENGYIPVTIQLMMTSVMENINAQFGTSYTYESFVGTNFYKYFYALIQELQASEVKTSEIFLKLQDYFNVTNERISRPVVTNPGIIEALAAIGYTASVKEPEEADAGTASICVDVDDGDHATGLITITSYADTVSGSNDQITIDGVTFTAQSTAVTPGNATFRAATSNEATATSLAAQINAHATTGAIVRATPMGDEVALRAIYGGVAANSYALVYINNSGSAGATVSGATFSGGADNEDYDVAKLEICTLIKNSSVAGVVTLGNQSESITLSNGQTFDFKYFLPNKLTAWLRLTLTLSENNQSVILSPEDVKEILIENINSKYSLGKNFEPGRYFTTVDAPWAGEVLLEYSLDGENSWSSSIYDADFDELFDVDLSRITVVEA